MRNLTLLVVALFASFNISYTQIVIGQDTLVGNEWIDYNKSYHKIMVSNDGYYRVSYDELKEAGLPIDDINGNEIQLFHFGKEQAIYVSNQGSFSANDYIEFLGIKNRGELDQYLYNKPEDQLNPRYSMFNDTSAYFITWDTEVLGKRYQNQQTDLSNNTLSPEPYYIHRDVVEFNNVLNKPTEFNSIRISQFLSGEGYASLLSANRLVTHNLSNIYFEGPQARHEILLSGNNVGHKVEISLNNNLLLEDSFFPALTRKYVSQIENALLSNATQVTVKNTNSADDKNVVSNSIIYYPRTFQFNNASQVEFNVLANPSDSYLELKDFNIGSGSVILIDQTNNIRYTPVLENGIVKVLLPADSKDRVFVLINLTESVMSVDTIVSAKFYDYSQIDDASYIILSSRVLDQPYTDGINYLNAYAAHRESVNGGSFQSQIVFVEDLYDQYAYGINKHPLSIKNFTRWMTENWPSQRYYFIIGKGIEYTEVRTSEQLSNPDPLVLKNLVPTFGIPGSDNTLMAKKNHSQPRVPTGRIAVANVKEIKNYYDKVVLREDPNNYPQTIEGKLWTKTLLHLAGGDPTIQEQIRNSLTNMGNILVQSKFGAKVEQIEKQSSDNIETPLTTKILENINAGTSIISFFGHSSTGTFDFSIEKASEYDNKGKLPIIFSMGCYSGNIHTDGKAISEDFVLEEEVGSIAFLASAGSAFIGPQGILGQKFYTELSQDYYGKSVGDIMYHLLDQYDTVSNADYSSRSLNEQFTLHGDPAIKIVTYQGPDYVLDYSSVITDPIIISPENKEFNLVYDMVNIGEGILDSVSVRAIQYLPDGTAFDTIVKKILAPLHTISDTLILTNPELLGIGKNCVTIEIDYDGKVNEQPNPEAEQNNNLENTNGENSFCFFVLDNSANPVFPENYAIVNGGAPKLIASTSNILAGESTFVMEIDTTALYNSNLNQKVVFTDGSGSLQWEPNITFIPGKVYYWRVSPDSTDVEIGYQWKQNSFIYLPNSSDGWNQSHYYQFLENNLEGINYKNRKLDFINQGISIFANLMVPSSVETVPRFYEDTFTPGQLRIWDLIEDGIGVAIRDNGINVWQTNPPPGLDGSYSKSGTTRIRFYNTTNQESRIALVNYLEDVLEEGYHAFVFTVTNKFDSDLHVEEWAQDSIINNGRNIFNTLEKQGATLVRQLEQKGTVPYGMVYTKNEMIRDENIANSILDVISIGSEFERNYIEGDLNTHNIGPAIAWDKMIWKVEDVTPNDEVMLYIKGIKNDGTMDTLYTVVNESEVDLSSISAEEYPYLRLDLYVKDEIDRIPANIDFWRVLFTAAPEAILTKGDSFVFNSDTLQQGEPLQFAINAENISSNDMDSLLVKYTITNELNTSIVKYDRLQPLKSNERLLLNFDYDTKDLSGKHQFNFEINPDDDQPEKFTFNNFGIKEFYVKQDNVKPIMDVTFDGIHIINGDLVAANPFILIEVKDENQFLLLNNPESFQIALIDPLGNRTDYELTDPRVKFDPATDPNNNRAKISFEPELVVDGTYTLLVQSKDATGNFSGANGYQVDFEVVLRESVSNVLNYPNPFSTQTQFVFTLTGSNVPDNISITILTVSGKVVKEISREDLGPLRIGHNRTDYKWDGTDDYGEKLANGVYLYKVNLPADMERYESGADRFFTKGFGKMVIMR